MDPVVTVVVSVLGSGGAAAFLAAWFGRRKSRAEGREAEVRAEIMVTQEYRRLAEELRSEMARREEAYERKVRELEKHVAELRGENAELRRQVEDLRGRIEELSREG